MEGITEEECTSDRIIRCSGRGSENPIRCLATRRISIEVVLGDLGRACEEVGMVAVGGDDGVVMGGCLRALLLPVLDLIPSVQAYVSLLVTLNEC